MVKEPSFLQREISNWIVKDVLGDLEPEGFKYPRGWENVGTSSEAADEVPQDKDLKSET